MAGLTLAPHLGTAYTFETSVISALSTSSVATLIVSSKFISTSIRATPHTELSFQLESQISIFSRSMSRYFSTKKSKRTFACDENVSKNLSFDFDDELILNQDLYPLLPQQILRSSFRGNRIVRGPWVRVPDCEQISLIHSEQNQKD